MTVSGIPIWSKNTSQTLSGTKSQWETITNQSGEVVTREESYEGKAGDNLVLTIDIDFQKEIEQIATGFLNSNVDSYNDRVYIVATDPNTGEILGMTGKQRSTSNEIVDDALGVINSSYGMGSAVKGATVLTGYMTGVISTDNNVLVDEPLQFQGSNLKKSVQPNHQRPSGHKRYRGVSPLIEYLHDQIGDADGGTVDLRSRKYPEYFTECDR